MKGAIVIAEVGTEKAINDLLKDTLDKKCFDAILIPVKVPAGDSYAYVLIQDTSLFEDASPLPPVMAVQGAKAISRLTKLGKGNMKIAAVMRPCEIRAAIELSKIEQTNLENITLIGIDCPGSLPLSDFLADPEKATKTFDNAILNWDSEHMREVCKGCVQEGDGIPGDLHIGTLGAEQDTFFIIPESQKGKEIVEKLDITAEESMEDWQTKVNENAALRQHKREQARKELESKVFGLDGLLDAFSQCINCHNCMRVCPICYCPLCFFDSGRMNHTSEEYLRRAENTGSLRFIPDTVLFHIGRMLHMSLSCVSCGTCEDACPMSIPVAQIFSIVAGETQGVFDYTPGKSIDEKLPLITFDKEELQELGE